MGVVFDGTHRSIGSVEPVVHVPYVVLLVNLVHIAIVAIVAMLCRAGRGRGQDVVGLDLRRRGPTRHRGGLPWGRLRTMGTHR